MRTVSELIGDGYLDWKPGIPYVLSSQTGRGKTTFVMTQLLKHAAAKNKDVLYICNRKSLYSQVEQIISNMMQELKSAFSLTEEESSHLIIQTYQYYEAGMRSPIMYSQKMYVIFDEAHYFVEDSSFNSGTNLWSDWINQFYKKAIHTETPICVFMTATPEPLKCFLAKALGKTVFSADSVFGGITESRKEKSKLKNDIKSTTEFFYRHYKTGKKDLDKDLPQKLLEEYPQVIEWKEDLQDIDIYGAGKKYIQDAVVADYIVQEIHDSTDYSYVEEYYFREFSELIHEITRSKEKWVLFINNSVKGQQYAQELNALRIETVFVSSSLKNKPAVKAQLKRLESKQSFSCKVLIATSVLDCGVNILDDSVRNVVIFETGKTTFMQMLGRVRILKEQKIRLFIKAPTALDIRNYVRYICKDIQIMYNFHMLQMRYFTESSEDDLIFNFTPAASATLRNRFLQNLKGQNYKAIYLTHNLIDGNNSITSTVKKKWNEGVILPEYEMNYCLLIYSLYMLYCFDQAKAYTQEGRVDDIYYLKYQLSWLGKEYDEHRWVSYTRQRDEITAFLDGYLTNEDGMLAEEQNAFAEKVFELLCQLSVIPSAAKKNHSALKRSGHAPGKNILNKCFEEVGLPYIITSKSKMQNGKREQRWYVKKANAETGNGELCY